MPAPTAPGAYVTISAAAPSPNLAERTGTWFTTGETQTGPVGVAIPITSMADYANYLGTRPGYTQLFDSLDEFFHDGGSFVYVSRIVGPTAVDALVVLKDTATTPANTLTVTANGAGVWANTTTVVVSAGSVSNTYVLTITDTVSGRIWASGNLTDPADAVTWANNLSSNGSKPWLFPYTITNDASATAAPANNPAVGTFTLATGADDLVDVVEAQWTAALTAFGSALGPGQVSAPGHNTAAGWEALISHASATDAAGALTNNRFALLDDADSSSASTIVGQVATAQAGSGDPSFAMFLGPWVVIPGVSASLVGGSPVASTRTVPPSALAAALMAANDGANVANVAAAGPNGTSTYAIGVTQTYNETDRGTLNSAGVSVIRQINGAVQLYGYMTIATNPSWTHAEVARGRMQLVDELNMVALTFAFQPIDGKGHLLSAFNGALSGVCRDYWARGGLFGATAGDAYQVNTSSAINTPTTINAGQLIAAVAVIFSRAAGFVLVNISSYAPGQSLPS